MTELCEGRVFLLKFWQGEVLGHGLDAKNSSHIQCCAVPRIFRIEGIIQRGKKIRERAAVGGDAQFLFGSKVKTPKITMFLWLQYV